jgi:DNA-binding NtrC family response regulator
MKRILLVEDDRESAGALADGLKREASGIRVMTVETGRQAADVLSTAVIDLLVIGMTSGAGDVAQLIAQARGRFPLLPVVVITGACSHETGEQLRSLGVTACMEKPVDARFAARIIQRLLARSRHKPRTDEAAAPATMLCARRAWRDPEGGQRPRGGSGPIVR